MNLHVVTNDDQISVMYPGVICQRCVLPDSFPDISFDAAGVCSYCRDERERVEVGKSAIDSAIGDAMRTADPQRAYDCLLLYSGGKDSSLALALATREYGLRVLAFTLDNGFLSERTGPNMRRVLDSVGADHMVFRPPRQLMRALYRTSVDTDFGPGTTKYSTAGCGSCISLVLATGTRVAAAHGIPLLLGGWTPGQFTNSPVVPSAFLSDVVRRHFDSLAKSSAPLGEDLAPWRTQTLRPLPVGLINPLYGTAYSEAAALAQLAHMGWQRPTDTDSCSTNCRLNGLLVLDHIKRFRYHPYVYELSHHVRIGAMGREEALQKMRQVRVSASRVAQVAAELGVPTPVEPAGEQRVGQPETDRPAT